MHGSREWTGVLSAGLLALTGATQALATEEAAALAHPRVGVVTARSASPDGSSKEETGNCLLWTAGERIYTLADLHTVMAGEEGASGRVADEIVVTVGRRWSRARLVWPPEGRRNVLEVDIAILELDHDIAGGQLFGPEDFQGAASDLPRELYLAAPGHRAKVISIGARAVRYGSQWFLYRELSQGDSGGMVFALQGGLVIPYGFVSSIGSLPGESARGTVVYGRDAMRIFISQFLRAGVRTAARP